MKPIRMMLLMSVCLSPDAIEGGTAQPEPGAAAGVAGEPGPEGVDGIQSGEPAQPAAEAEGPSRREFTIPLRSTATVIAKVVASSQQEAEHVALTSNPGFELTEKQAEPRRG